MSHHMIHEFHKMAPDKPTAARLALNAESMWNYQPPFITDNLFGQHWRR
jgi:hypothetical protein